ncbi:ankyrin repeat domain-containing protein [Iodidimonas muriae]|uniref:ankyrin repeat domain-containing protein n=1 Tax=Iodidimonas muriae TaxID=261467 RepID=UPI0012304F1A
MLLAAQNGHTDTVIALIDARADHTVCCQNPASGETFTALDIAQYMGHHEIVALLNARLEDD